MLGSGGNRPENVYVRTSLSIAAILLLGACDPPEDPRGVGFIAPLDGQSNVATNQDLLIRTGGLDLPDKYAIPQSFIQVVNLTEGGFVSGEVVRDEDDIRFLPNKAWEADTRYVWSISQIPALPRTPEYDFPENLTGEAVFDTSPAVDVLDIGLEEDEEGKGLRPCGLFSREIVAPNAEVNITIDDVIVDDVTFDIYSEDEWAKESYKRVQDDPGVSVVCFNGIGDLEGGESLRLWWNESGPWQAILDSGTDVSTALMARRRSK